MYRGVPTGTLHPRTNPRPWPKRDTVRPGNCLMIRENRRDWRSASQWENTAAADAMFSMPGLTVEECCALDVVFVMRERATRPGAIHSGTWHWRCSRTGTIKNSVGYVIDMNDAHVRLHYTFRSEVRSHRIELVSTVPNYGGLRWWFLCPGWVQGRVCLRRVRKLYCKPGVPTIKPGLVLGRWMKHRCRCGMRRSLARIRATSSSRLS
jgi:hypothetical protein